VSLYISELAAPQWIDTWDTMGINAPARLGLKAAGFGRLGLCGPMNIPGNELRSKGGELKLMESKQI
jgi:hypothetical protein